PWPPCSDPAPEALESGMRRNGIGIGLLPLHAPIEQLVERNWFLRDGAAHEAAGPDHVIFAIAIAEHRFGGRKSLVEDVHASCPSGSGLIYPAMPAIKRAFPARHHPLGDVVSF